MCAPKPIKIILTQGKEALIDEEDYEMVNKHTWYAHKQWGYYARTNIRKNKKRTCILMHRFIMGAKKGQMIDHINCNGLDNRRSNLRFCTPTGNSINRRKNIGCSSKYKGVHWHNQNRKWRSQIMINKKSTQVGMFECEIVAARAYDQQAIRLHGEFAKLNFPPIN